MGGGRRWWAWGAALLLPLVSACVDRALAFDDGGGDTGSLEPELPDLGAPTEPCAADERVRAGRCVPCPPGSQRPAGDDPSGPDTRCDPIICAADQRVHGHRCVPCPEGLVNGAGDDATGADTSCGDRCEAALGLTCPEFREAYVKASNTGEFDGFGETLALWEDTLLVGAPGEDGVDDDIHDSGAAYVYRRGPGRVWAFEAYLKPDDLEARAEFGRAVALHGDTAAVRGKGADGRFAVYLFAREPDGRWGQADRLDGQDWDLTMGGALALWEDRLVTSGVGGVQIFERNHAGWNHAASLQCAPDDPDHVGSSDVALWGEWVAFGCPSEVDGAAYVYRRDPSGAWIEEARVAPTEPRGALRFGSALSLWERTLVVGMPSEHSGATGVDGDELDTSASRSGAAYVFEADATGSWTTAAYLKARNTRTFADFGSAVAAGPSGVAVGSWWENSGDLDVDGEGANDGIYGSGAVYLYRRDPQLGWVDAAYIKASNTERADGFGSSVSMWGDTLAVGAVREDSAATGVGGDESNNDARDSGAVYIRRLSP